VTFRSLAAKGFPWAESSTVDEPSPGSAKVERAYVDHGATYRQVMAAAKR
jgi:hypothetical protein